jgi:uncharacterized membrane protein
MALFALVIVALLFAVFAWLLGMINALRGRQAKLPLAGNMANFLSSLLS